MALLEKYSFGIGDRFGFEGEAQLRAVVRMRERGIAVTPVWNKSHREHNTVGSQPATVKQEAEKAVAALEYRGPFWIDADHINLKIVEPYLAVSNFFTIDVADFIGQKAEQTEKDRFLKYISKYTGQLEIPGIDGIKQLEQNELDEIINTFLFAAKNAAEVYDFINTRKEEAFTVEVSMDEVDRPQTPVELFFALAALAFYEIPVNTIAPKFTGRFNKGVDYEGDLQVFEREFEEDIHVLSFARKEFGLPEDLKLSIHSGSDKFSIYPIMNSLIQKHDVGLHVKTAGTTWLEEITVLAESGDDGFHFALNIYREALKRFEELTAPYPDVLDINRSQLPDPEELAEKGGQEMAKALRHDQNEEKYNPDFRQLMHCSYKVAAEKKEEFFQLSQKYRSGIEQEVTANLLEKHLVPLFTLR